MTLRYQCIFGKIRRCSFFIALFQCMAYNAFHSLFHSLLFTLCKRLGIPKGDVETRWSSGRSLPLLEPQDYYTTPSSPLLRHKVIQKVGIIMGLLFRYMSLWWWLSYCEVPRFFFSQVSQKSFTPYLLESILSITSLSYVLIAFWR